MNKYQYVVKSHNSGILVLTLTTGDLRTPEVSYALRDELVDAVADEAGDLVILDMHQVASIGSMGVLGFLSLRRVADLKRIVLCNLSEPIRSFFLACRLLSGDADRESPFEHADSLAEALPSS